MFCCFYYITPSTCTHYIQPTFVFLPLCVYRRERENEKVLETRKRKEKLYKPCGQAQPLLPVLPKKPTQISQLEDLSLPCLFNLGSATQSRQRAVQTVPENNRNTLAPTGLYQASLFSSRAFTGNDRRNTLGSKNNIFQRKLTYIKFPGPQQRQ